MHLYGAVHRACHMHLYGAVHRTCHRTIKLTSFDGGYIHQESWTGLIIFIFIKGLSLLAQDYRKVKYINIDALG